MDEARETARRNGMRRTSRVRIPSIHLKFLPKYIVLGMNRVKENLHAQLEDLKSKKPKGKTDEALILEIGHLESSLVVAQSDLVCGRYLCWYLYSHPSLECCRTS